MDKLVQEFPEVFNGQVTTMKGEKFIERQYHLKLKEELELLQNQEIIVPVTEVTEWCAPIVVTTKKGSD